MQVRSLGRAELDLLRPDKIEESLREPFDCLLNAAGTTAVDYCESHEEEARMMNASAPALIATICARHGARMIHFSTDYVFSGEGDRLLTEADAAEPVNTYGRTKLEGERLVLAASPESLAVRVSWLFGHEGRPTFPDNLIARALESEDLSAVADKWSCPTYVEDLASWVLHLIQQRRDVRGLLHLCNAGACTWQEYGQFTIDFANDFLHLPLKGRTVAPIQARDVVQFVARRPRFTAMDTRRFTHLTGIEPRPWQEAVREYLRARHDRAR
jgi:dTDP-4-dehydrorhamnose reductase